MRTRYAKLVILCLGCLNRINAQNALINIITENGGVFSKGSRLYVSVSVCNTDATDSFPIYKLKPQISVPDQFVVIEKEGHDLPLGWTIISNDGNTVRLSNGEDRIPPAVCRTVRLVIRGIKVGGPSTISGNLSFSNGKVPGSVPGSPAQGDLPADNASTTTCTVKR